jgi:uncharacterized protein YndB with AHSA1/START domain
MTSHRIETSRPIAAPIEDVWAAVVDPASLAEWFGADVLEFDAGDGGRLVIRTDDGFVRRASVEECRRPDRLVLRWLPIEERPDGSTHPLVQTTVEITLHEIADGTLVTIVETLGFISSSRPPSMLSRA